MVKFPSLQRFHRWTSDVSLGFFQTFRVTALMLMCLYCWPLPAQSAPQQTGTRISGKVLRIAAAADLQPVLPPILKEYKADTGIEAEATYQASAALTMQIENGAPFDVFLSADLGYPKRLIDTHLADTKGVNGTTGNAAATYARGALVLWTHKDGRWAHPSLATLGDPALKHLAIANPERAPYGRAAIIALTNLKLLDALKPKLVTAENIAQAAQYAESGNADAGLISMTSAQTMHLKTIGTAFLIPKDLYPPIEQGAVIVSKTGNHEAARGFLNYLLSPPIQEQLGRSGLTPVR